jgi:hypothetical protein
MMELTDIERRQPKYWGVDGLPQLVTGVGWLLWGSLYLIGIWLLERRSYRVYCAILTGVVLLWGIAVQLALGKLKARVTYPRAGYAGMRIGEHGILRHIAGPLLLGAMTLSLAGLRVDLSSFGPFLAGGLIALAIAEPAMGPASKHHLEVLYWGFLLELALWLTMLLQLRGQTANDTVVYLTLVCMGLIGTVFGALRLRRFLRENPKPAETEV